MNLILRVANCDNSKNERGFSRFSLVLYVLLISLINVHVSFEVFLVEFEVKLQGTIKTFDD